MLLYGVMPQSPRRCPRHFADGAIIAQIPRGVAEFRVVNGGYFIGLAGFALLVNQPLVYAALGIGWLGAAVGRIISFILDRPPLEPIYIALLLFEIAMGIMLLV